ncbi:MAG: mandelate racemase/muconate lactonizing enzyme family protein, partial [bacterium]
MKITDIKTAVIKGNFEWTLVRVYTDEGITGIGEAYWGAGVKDIIHYLKGMLVGQDPLNVDYLFHRMMRGMSGAGSIAGATVTAISGVEIALWDVVGKVLSAPVYNLLGGKFRDKIGVYADCGGSIDLKACADKAQRVKAMGYTAIKFDTHVP